MSHKKHRRRGFGSSMSVSLGSIGSALRAANWQEVGIGAGAGLVGATGADYLSGKALEMVAAKWPNVTVPPTVLNLVPFLGSAVVGGAIYALRKNKQAGARNLAGALAAGAVVSGTKLAAQFKLPGFGSLMSVNMGLITDTSMAGRRSYGMLTDINRRPNMGLITDTASKQAALNAPARYNAIMEEEIG